jgi:hypothetical protein
LGLIPVESSKKVQFNWTEKTDFPIYQAGRQKQISNQDVIRGTACQGAIPVRQQLKKSFEICDNLMNNIRTFRCKGLQTGVSRLKQMDL